MANVKGIAHIAIQAEDFEKTANFYINALEFTEVYRWSLPQYNLEKAAMLASNDGLTMIELFDNKAEIAGQGRKRGPGDEIVKGALLHFALKVDDVQAAYEAALKHGATPCIPPSTFELGHPGKTVTNALVYSPNGEVLEFLSTTIF
ncbi:VOC family protein [uncultured Desulfovibrio sp.]|uniref:VOC family protein n=1 Tax=uncultured Desulfovibrio sp. TaxID=167968 RepID=UPI0026085BF3|nr:VOC family protein [uncultured Desulfovibrio sp.]